MQGELAPAPAKFPPLLEIGPSERSRTRSVSKEEKQAKPDSGRQVSRIASVFSSTEKTKELESIIALKSRQVARLQKEVKSLLQIQQQQAHTIESTFEDGRDLEEKIHSYEQKERVSEKTVKLLKDKLQEVTIQYQRVIQAHMAAIGTDDKSPQKKKPTQTQRRNSQLESLRPKQPELSAVGKTVSKTSLSSPLPPVPLVGSPTKGVSASISSPNLATSVPEPQFHPDEEVPSPEVPTSSSPSELLAFVGSIAPLQDRDGALEQLISQELGKLTRAGRVNIFIVDRVKGSILLRNSKSKDGKAFRFPIGTGIVGTVAKSGVAVLCEDMGRHDCFDARIDDRTSYRARSALFVPVRERLSEVIAVVQLLNLQEVFTEDDENFVATLEPYLAAAIGNYLHLKKTRKDLRIAQDLLAACKAISADMDIGPLAQTIASYSTRLLKCEGCNLYLLDGGTQQLCLVTSDKEEKRWPVHKGIVGQVATSGQDVLVADVRDDPRYDPEVDQVRDKRTSNILCIPIKNENEDILGVIEVVNKQGGAGFSPRDIAILKSLTEQIFQSLSNAELFHKTLAGFNAALSVQQKYQSLLEVAELLASELDQDNLVRFIMVKARELVNAERCSLFLVDSAKRELTSKMAEGAEEIRFPLSVGIAGHVATTGETLNISDAYQDPRFNEAIDKQTGYHTRSILCMPISSDKDEVVGVTQLINKIGGEFEAEDEEILRVFSIFCGIALRNADLYKGAVKAQHHTKALLDVAVALSSDTSIQPLLRSIMKHARKLIKADRCSLFVLDPENQELRTEIAEGIEGGEREEIKLPMQKGLVGFVASTGEDVNVVDAYKDPRFNPEVDKATGYNTKSVLCVPVRNAEGKVVAVTQMINKRNGIFHEEDKQLLKAFAAFAEKTLGTLHTVPVNSQEKKAALLDARWVPSAEDREVIKSWTFDVWKYTQEGLMRVVVAMFEHFNLIRAFAIPMERLVNFLHALCKSYRDVPYHNFYHACDVAQTVFLFIYHGRRIQKVLPPEDILAVLLAALCHDVDHGGLNNAFHVKAQTPLALLYKDMSVLETHHCSRSITLLSETESDVLSGLTERQYSHVWKTLISAILATDMALHFALLGQFESITKNNGWNSEEENHRRLLSNMLLKCADISNVVKPFPIAKRWAEILCMEFFMQGDIEKAKGLERSPLMDRDTVIMPQMQLGFINSICVPIFTLLTSFEPTLKITLETLKENIQEWNKILKKGLADNKPS